MKKVNRNDPCPCRSGKKYKQCCQRHEEAQTAKAHSTDASTHKAIQTALEHHQAGRLPQAEAIYRQILQVAPNHPDALHFLGAIACHHGQNEIAVELISKAISVSPSRSMYYNLGNALQALGKLDEAVESYRKALLLKPDYAEAHNNLGSILKDQGKLDEAVEHYRKALALKPGLFETHCNLGKMLQMQGKLDEAASSFQRALLLKPDYAEAHYNLGGVLKAQGKPDEAVGHFRKALLLKPDYAEAHYNLGELLQAQGRLDEAIAHYHKTLLFKPECVEAHYGLGCVFQAQGRAELSAESYRKALALKPDFAEAHLNLGLTLQMQGKLDAAVEHYRNALSIKPDYAEAYNNMGLVFLSQGKLDAAAESYQRALLIRPDFADAYGNLLFMQGYHALLDPQAYLALARGWELACLTAQDRQAAHDRVFQRLPVQGRRLKVGYVSGDYRQHAMSYFVEQLFTHHDRARIELFAYSTNSQRDAVTERLQALVDHWVSIVGISDAVARDRIEADGIDVLIDLSGHTAGNRLGVFARRAAPVQAYYLGYFASTGLTEMDYWIGDNVLTPPETDGHFSEQVWRLPRVWVSYEGKAEAPLPGWRPATDGTVWVGSFNNLGKLTPATLALWARVLHALPEGRLLLKTKELADAGNRQRILDAMASHGILSNRIELQDSGATPGWAAHMAYYDRLDIALDPVGGVGGGTTTCDALWMGVPIITLEGDRMASRMSVAMLNAIGHPEWIARTEAEYVDKVVSLARDVEQRKALRSGQRERMAASPLCDAKGLTLALEEAYFEMFGRFVKSKVQ